MMKNVNILKTNWADFLLNFTAPKINERFKKLNNYDHTLVNINWAKSELLLEVLAYTKITNQRSMIDKLFHFKNNFCLSHSNYEF